jgi:hypothetical protein
MKIPDRITKIHPVFFAVLLILPIICSRPLWAGEVSTQTVTPRLELIDQTFWDKQARLMWSPNGGLSETTHSRDGAFEYIAELNRSHFAGYSDWRLPTREEFLSLVDHFKGLGFDGSTPEKTITAGLRNMGIENAHAVAYWTSTTSFFNASEAWFVDLKDGSSRTGNKTLYLSIWPVRSVQPQTGK